MGLGLGGARGWIWAGAVVGVGANITIPIFIPTSHNDELLHN